MSTTARILIFDSGVGGLSILQEIHQQYPHCSFFYASDNAAFPYGTKTEDELVERVDHVLHQLEQATQADIIVVACNSASTVALPRIRERFAQPVIGAVPAIKPAAAISHSKTIGLLATPGTVNRQYTQELINAFASDCRVIRVGSSALVTIAENKLRGEHVSQDKINAITAPFLTHPDLDTIVLACTHFPLLKNELQQSLPHVKQWIDSGEAIARRVGYWLDTREFTKTTSKPVSMAYFTENKPDLQSLKPILKTIGIKEVSILDIPL
jgi:glutamate racemase